MKYVPFVEKARSAPTDWSSFKKDAPNIQTSKTRRLTAGFSYKNSQKQIFLLRYCIMFFDKKIKAKIIEFKEDRAVLEFDKRQIDWPANKLPQNKGIGDIIILEAKSPEETAKKDKAIASEILNQILNP